MHCPCGNPLKLKQKKFCSIQCHNTANSQSRINRIIVNCLICKKPFTTRAKRIGKYCSQICMGISKNQQIDRTCLQCGVSFKRKLSEVIRFGGKFCSRKCRDTGRTVVITVKCQTCGQEDSNTAKYWDINRKYCSRTCATLSGENNPNWKGGITPENMKIRHSDEYKLWRTAVFQRDKFQCQMCGGTKSGSLHANHIKRFCDYPDLRFEINNGITLCNYCHISIVTGHETEWEVRLTEIVENKHKDLTTVDLVG